VTNETDNDKSNAYREEQHQRFDYLESQKKLNANDEHLFIEFVLDDVSLGVNQYGLRYYPESYYSRLQFPRAPEFPVPIQPGMFTAISAWPVGPDVDNQHIKWSRQLVLLSYDQDEKKVGGLRITVLICAILFYLLTFTDYIYFILGGFELSRRRNKFPGGSQSLLHWFGPNQPRSEVEGFSPSTL